MFQIIFLGLIFNILSVIFLLSISMYVISTEKFSPELQKKMLLLREGVKEEKRLRELLRHNKKSPLIQTDMIPYLPFAGGFWVLSFMASDVLVGIIQQLDNNIFRLQQKCSSNGISYHL